MQKKTYSAGAVKFSFWFMEFRKAVELLHAGRSMKEIRELSEKQNIFGARTKSRAHTICSTVLSRIRALPPSFYPLFMESDVTTQKLFALSAAMASDTLFFEFMYEVIREKMLIGSNEYSDSDVRIFFHNKQTQSGKVASWTEETLQRLGRTYKSMLFEAGITDKGMDVRKIKCPVMDPELLRWLTENDMMPIAHALAGV